MTNLEKIQLCQEIVNQIQAENRKPACYLEFSQEPFGVTDSHLGGVPYVPRDGQIPVSADGHQLWLCAQINFAQMPPLEGFPDRGILQLFASDFDKDGGFGFYDGEYSDQNAWRVVYYGEVDDTVTEAECAAKMVVPWEEASKKNMPRPAHKFDLKDIEEGNAGLWRIPAHPLKIAFRPVVQDAIGDNDFRFDDLFAAELARRLPGADPEAFLPYSLRDETFEEREILHRIYDQLKSGGCKLGGYAYFEQYDFREDDEALAPWDILLFQLHDDFIDFPAGEFPEMDLYLGGFGSLNILIQPEDLKNRDFSRVLGYWATS
ncbi:MAG: DUF1963 domain-containing protein [Lawsonibacter sp.]|nr:DUF1963 domain-containing protein [Lawsonibacter sp.]